MSEVIIKPTPGILDITREGPLSRICLCFQCKKCSNGCPVAGAMEILPHQVMRLLQLGIDEEPLKSNTIWICASCEACTTRCPNDIDIAGVMDELRAISSQKGTVAVKNVEQLHKVFLGQVKMLGRVHEISMLGIYKLFSYEWFKDLKLGMKMFLKQKLKLIPSVIKGRKEMRRLFKKLEKK